MSTSVLTEDRLLIRANEEVFEIGVVPAVIVEIYKAYRVKVGAGSQIRPFYE